MDSATVMKIIMDVNTTNVIIAVDDDEGRVYLTTKFGPDPRPRSYLWATTTRGVKREIRQFDRSLQ